MKAVKRRMEVLHKKLKSRTTHDGESMPGFKSNVAAIRAELAQLQESMEIDDE